MYYAQLTNGICTSVTETYGALPESPDLILLSNFDATVIGKRFNAGHWEVVTPSQPAVPAKVTRRQARQALLLAGKLSMVEPAINAIPDATQRAMIMIEWQDSLEFERNRPSLIALATAIGMTSADIDALFVQAAKL